MACHLVAADNQLEVQIRALRRVLLEFRWPSPEADETFEELERQRAMRRRVRELIVLHP